MASIDKVLNRAVNHRHYFPDSPQEAAERAVEELVPDDSGEVLDLLNAAVQRWEISDKLKGEVENHHYGHNPSVLKHTLVACVAWILEHDPRFGGQ